MPDHIPPPGTTSLPYNPGPATYTSDILKINTQPFADKVITVCGASRGTGLATVKYLLIRGATVSMCSSSQENIDRALKEVQQLYPEHKDRVVARKCDIRNLQEVEQWIEDTVQKFGRLDGCANTAGKSDAVNVEFENLCNREQSDPNRSRAA
jgi:NAD(P)-dependent dehydrogenase (short-subunit alcohol dehydrogenase family)